MLPASFLFLLRLSLLAFLLWTCIASLKSGDTTTMRMSGIPQALLLVLLLNAAIAIQSKKFDAAQQRETKRDQPDTKSFGGGSIGWSDRPGCRLAPTIGRCTIAASCTNVFSAARPRPSRGYTRALFSLEA